MVCAMRCTTCRTLVSPLVESPWIPAFRKYFETTISVASCDQAAGISAPSILKTTDPSEFVMTLRRRSQTTSSSGGAPAVVKRRSRATPLRFLARAFWPLARGEDTGSEAPFIDLICPTISDCAMTTASIPEEDTRPHHLPKTHRCASGYTLHSWLAGRPPGYLPGRSSSMRRAQSPYDAVAQPLCLDL